MGIKDDGKALAALFKAIPAEVKRAIEPAIDQGATEIMMRARFLAPVGDGDLQASIKTEPGPRELSVSVVAGGERTTRPVRDGASVTYDYALAQEYGTEEMPNPQSFFWPAVNSTKKRVKRRIDRAISKAIKDKFNGGS